MTAPAARRWCEQHRRFECASLRRYRTAYCHTLPLRGTETCRAHTLRTPAATARELAHQLVRTAISEGRLIRPSACELCHSTARDWRTWAIHAHHEDYARPLDVIWLCAPCHRRVHVTHGGLPTYLAWLHSQLADAERLHARFYDRQLAERAVATA